MIKGINYQNNNKKKIIPDLSLHALVACGRGKE
jgi:hypothetical protein